MNELVNARAAGRLGQNAFARRVCADLLHTFRPAPRLRFDGGELGTNIDVDETGGPSRDGRGGRDMWAHQAGVNALALERFDGRIMVSGGSDATIRIWDLEQADLADPSSHTFRPVAEIARAGAVGSPNTRGPFRAQQQQQQQATHLQSSHTPAPTSQGHRFGVTHLSFYPFDNAAFLSSSFDQTLKLWATDSARLSGSFGLGSKVYSHAVSPVADHLLVACATQHPAVRLVDLRSGAAVQSLVAAGQVAGAVLSVAWSPRHEHVLASGAVDGTVRIWDVRRASGLLALLDQEDSLGPAGSSSGSSGSTSAAAARPPRASAKAHAGPVNGLAWTDDGAFLVSAGHDRRIRVWDMATGANTLVSFGPSVRNSGLSSVPMVVTPSGLTAPRQELLVWPNESEVLVFRLHDGSIVTRLRGTGATQAAVRLPQAPPPPPRAPQSLPPSSSASSSSSSARPRPSVAPTTVDRSSARRNRVTSLVWRGAGGLGSETGGTAMGGRDAVGGLYSGHLDGQIRAWAPSASTAMDNEDVVEDDADATPQALEERDRKRRALDQAYRSLMGTQITFR
ncbi:hypothetical protein HMPREF1624_07466 [Sporothrix schenckii ATCC 58251]|uniref:Uncharacterized protein n=2 Tax=Sporothrix schenckii TaxID=29908 RepID=U7PK55_SPOS1|nr:hypothetical protein HMPREF1624_07466 [Sporothrix schenckii ATCC 58251]